MVVVTIAHRASCRHTWPEAPSYEFTLALLVDFDFYCFEEMGSYPWWSRKIGAEMRKTKPLVNDLETEYVKPNVALIVGVTGIVGHSLAEILPRPDTPGGPWKAYGIARGRKPEWFTDSPIEYIQCDVLNREETLEKISPLNDVTHLFWVVRVNHLTEEELCRDNGSMLQNALDALLPNAPNFQHICLQTGGKHYMGTYDLTGKVEGHEPPFHENMPRLPRLEFYYTLEDITFDAAKKKQGLTWSIHRPAVIFGFSPRSFISALSFLSVYATICKHEGLPFRYPGNEITWQGFTTISDAELVAEQEIWAATDPNAKNEAFNITNGDVINFKRLWHLLGQKFELQVPPYNGEPVSLQEILRDKGPVWDAIVAKHGLLPTKMEEVGNWVIADYVMNLDVELVLNMNKSKELGFFGFRNTETSLLYWIDKMKEKKMIP